MLKVELDEDAGIAILKPDGKLSENDFETARKIIDPYLEQFDELKGIIIHVKSFPGWDSFSSLVAHLKFVKEHHKRISRIALATNSPVGSIAENVARHFVNAEIKTFDVDELEAARKWVLGSET